MKKYTWKLAKFNVNISKIIMQKDNEILFLINTTLVVQFDYPWIDTILRSF